MKRAALVGSACFMLGAIALAFAQSTGLRPDQFIALPWTWTGIQSYTAGTLKLLSSGGTSQVVKQTTSGGALTVAQLACADLSDAAGGCSTTGGTTVLNASALIETLANDTGTGTTAAKLVKLTNAGKVVIATTSDVSNVIGVCVSGITGTSCGTSGNASVAIAGQVSCVFDNATTAGDFVIVSTGTNGDCHDAGSTAPAAVFIIGQVHDLFLSFFPTCEIW